MNEQQRKRAQEVLRNSTDIEAVGEAFALLQELIDADTRFRSLVSAAIHGADTDARSVVVDGKSVFFSRDGDGITDTHTLNPCPHCGGSGASEDCKQAAGVPDDEPVAAQARYMAVKAGLPSYGNSKFGPWQPAPMPKEGDLLKGVDSVGYAYEIRLLYAAPQAPAVQPDQSEHHLEMVKQELFQAQQALLNEGQQRDKLLAALDELLSGTMSMPNRGRATEGKWTTINALTDTVEKARSVVAEAKGA